MAIAGPWPWPGTRRERQAKTGTLWIKGVAPPICFERRTVSPSISYRDPSLSSFRIT
jgi:hypothetical protein